MHSSRMRTARSSSRPGGLHQAPPHLGADPPGTDTPPGGRTTRRTDAPPEQTPPPVNGITDACENTTLPQLRCGR